MSKERIAYLEAIEKFLALSPVAAAARSAAIFNLPKIACSSLHIENVKLINPTTALKVDQ